jgi:transcriptional regulator with XRE-family HTH domain
MGIKEIAQANLRRCMAHAGDHGHPELASKKGLALAAGVARRTVQAMEKAERAVAIDTLEMIAGAYGIPAWALLVEEFDPAWFANRGDIVRGLVRGAHSTARTVVKVKDARAPQAPSKPVDSHARRNRARQKARP